MMARVSSPEAPPVRAAVLGRYAGVVEVLANLLRTDGITVVTTWAANADDGPLPQPDDDVVPVVPVSPGDDTLDRLRQRGSTAHVVGVSWHPPDEQPDSRAPRHVGPRWRDHRDAGGCGARGVDHRKAWLPAVLTPPFPMGHSPHGSGRSAR